METVGVCPLGCECERIVDDHIERCNWYVAVDGDNPQTGEKIQESKCAMNWIPLLQIESTGVNINLRETLQTMRNETLKNQLLALGKMKDGIQISSDS